MRKTIKSLTIICVLLAIAVGAYTQTSTISLSGSTPKTVYGENVTFTATVEGDATVAIVPTGTVKLEYNGGVSLGSTSALIPFPLIKVTSAASLTTNAIEVGTWEIMPTYSGDGFYAPSTTTTHIFEHTVYKAETEVDFVIVTLADDHHTLSVMVQILAVAPGSGTPTGTVEFHIDVDGMGDIRQIDCPLSAGRATLIASFPFTPGTHNVQAIYLGDNNFLGSQDDGGIFEAVNKPGFASTATIEKTYGDPPFSLPAVSGGYPDGGGPYSYSSENPNVASVDASTGEVTVVAPGETNMYVKQLARDGYPESLRSDPVKVIVHRKELTVSGIIARKDYDGTNIFTNEQIDITEAVIDGIVGSDVVTLSKAGITGTFGPEVGSGMLMYLGSFSLVGDDAWKYSLQQPTIIATISLAAIPYFEAPSIIYKTYGDPSFFLPAVHGGLGNGAYSYRSDNPAVATVDAIGYVTVVSPGEAKMYVKRLADANFSESEEGVPVKVVVSPKPLTVTGITAVKEYDGTNVFTNAQIDITQAVINGIVGSDDITLSKTGVTGTFGPNAGTGTLTLSGSFTLVGADVENYTLTPPTVTATITRADASITVTAIGGSSFYGDSPANPGLSATGLIGGETVSVLTGLSNSFGITATTLPGIYTLTVLGTLTNPNYTISARIPGEWTVNKRPITITAISKIIDLGETPVLEYEITKGNLVNGDQLTGEIYCAPPYTVGTHAITQGTLTAGDNYDITFIEGTLSVITEIVTVQDISIDGMPALRNGNNFTITSPCGANSADVTVNTDQPATVIINNVQQNPCKVDLPNYGDNTFHITVTSLKGNSETFTLTVYKSVPVEIAFYDRFRNVLTVPEDVEGIIGAVNSVEWYHNGVRLDRDSGKGYLEMKEAGVYYALLNGQFRTCEVNWQQNRSSLAISVYPNPVDVNRVLTVAIENAEEGELRNAQLQFHGMDGRLLQTVPVTGNIMQVTTPVYTGVMVLKLVSSIGNKEVKLIVK